VYGIARCLPERVRLGQVAGAQLKMRPSRLRVDATPFWECYRCDFKLRMVRWDMEDEDAEVVCEMRSRKCQPCDGVVVA
jgi:hypothetical protein